MSGFEVCRRIKADPRTAAIPVIQVSATAVEVADRAHGLTQGADAYLVEPTEPAELLATVTAALRYSRARQRAERTAAMLAALAGVTLDINAAETFDGLAAAAAAGAARIFSVPAVLILEMPDGQARRMSAAPGSPGTVRRGGPPGLAGRVAGPRARPRRRPARSRPSAGTTGCAIVPDSTLREDVCVAVARTKPAGRRRPSWSSRAGMSGEEDMQVLRQLAQSVALGVEALRSSAEEHLVALTLQRSFLPAALPAIPGVTMAFRYLPASDQAEVGGDFYEALPWRDGVLVAIGDVQGHSLHAATVMGELRHALRAFASEGHSPVAITGLVNEVLRRYHPGIMATLCLVLLDPGDRRALDRQLRAHAAAARRRRRRGLRGRGRADARPDPPRAAHRDGRPARRAAPPCCSPTASSRIARSSSTTTWRSCAPPRLQAADADVEAFANHVMSLFGPREDDVAMIVLRRTG